MKAGDAVRLTLEGLVYLTEVCEYYNLGWDSVGLVVKKYECQFYDIYIEGHIIKMLSGTQIEEI